MTFCPVLATSFFTYTAYALVVVGTAVSAYAQYQQAKTTEQVALYNRDQRAQEAKQQLLIGQVQQKMEMQRAEAEKAAALAQSAAAERNADATIESKKALEAQSRENVQRARAEARRQLAEQEAGFISAGVVTSTGTPIAVLAEAVKLNETNAADIHYGAVVEGTKLQFEADMERSGAKFGAGMAEAQFRLDTNAAKVRGISNRIDARNKVRQANLDLWGARQSAKQQRLAAIGTGVSGVSSAAAGAGSFASSRTAGVVASTK